MCLSSTVTAAIIPVDQSHVVSLDGQWRFKLEQAQPRTNNWGTQLPVDYPAAFEPFFKADYKEDAGWHDIKVPSNWEMAGYSPATYGQPDNASGFYRKWINIPADWAGRIVKVNFDGVQNGAEIWLNGQPVNVTEPSWGRSNYHESGWTAWQADLTPAVKFGEPNLLALRVTKNTKSVDLDTGDYFFLGGIYRPVTLFSLPQAHIEDITIQTRLLPDNKAEVKVIAVVSGPAKQVFIQLRGFQPMGVAVTDNQAVLTQIVPNPRLWSAEHPNLYPINISLQDNTGKTVEHVVRKVGIREITIKNGVLLVNGKPVKLEGICRHDVSARDGSAVGPDLWRKDLLLMKAANINAIRTSHYPYGSGFYDLCDEMGFYVADELPYCWAPTNDASLEAAFTQRARETIARDKNHPSVIIWAVGNENKDGCNNQTVADLVKKLDPTRLRLVSCKNADLYGTDFDDSHYRTPKNMLDAGEDKERRQKWPFIYLENPNVWDVRFGADFGSLDRWTDVLRRVWDVTWKFDTLPGSFLWEWQDRAVADKCPTKLYQYDPVTGIQYVKTKGLVDAFRNPRPDYYAVKMVYAPIVAGRSLDPSTHPGTAVIDVTNRYSFTDLSELNTNWKLTKDDNSLGSGTEHLKLAPMTSGKVRLDLPIRAMAKADTLRIDFNDPRGWNVVSYQFALAAKPITSKFDQALPVGLKFPRINLVVNATPKNMQCDPYRAELKNVKIQPVDSVSSGSELLGKVRSIDADIIMRRDLANDKAAKDHPELNGVVGHVHAEYADNQLRYELEWTGPRSEIQELGWVLDMPKAYDHFSWNREAIWSVYPEKHIGRPAGTALPDSANVHLTDITRPDAFDFNSTKYNCNWATLTDASGQGLRVEFDANQRYQVKAGFGADGGYTLVVNKQCSPPVDISSSTVSDFYLWLSPGDKIEGAFKIGSNKVIKAE